MFDVRIFFPFGVGRTALDVRCSRSPPVGADGLGRPTCPPGLAGTPTSGLSASPILTGLDIKA